MAFISPDFDNIKIIMCTNGYKIDGAFYLREIGYCYNNVSASVPFNFRINKSKIDVTNQFIIDYMEDERHGIKFDKKFEYGLSPSEIVPVIKTLYHLNSNSNAKYIAICKNDEGIKGLLYRAGFGQLIIELDHLNILQLSNIQIPTDNDIITNLSKDMMSNPCYLHDRLKTAYKPLCAKTKADYLYNYCKKIYEKYLNQINLETKPNINTII